ncbi:MAG: FHA domain-containing protein, partial [Planctomycetes bacterium]|nr:FHA domain-containing protein [Planctomycetota bacterium]
MPRCCSTAASCSQRRRRSRRPRGTLASSISWWPRAAGTCESSRPPGSRKWPPVPAGPWRPGRTASQGRGKGSWPSVPVGFGMRLGSSGVDAPRWRGDRRAGGISGTRPSGINGGNRPTDGVLPRDGSLPVVFGSTVRPAGSPPLVPVMITKLIVASGKSAGRSIAIKRTKLLIGRAEECDVRPLSEEVSRRHCAVVVGPADVWIEDLGSRNGTFVNGTQIQGRTKLADGDMIRVGSLELRVSCQS